MKLDCIHHVAIIVSNYQAALEFYRDKLGADEMNEWILLRKVL